MAIPVHHRDFDQDTPHEAARAALSQADMWGAAEALGLEISTELEPDNGMDLYISGPLHHIMDLYDIAKVLAVTGEISQIEVGSQEDERILRRYLGEELESIKPGRLRTPTTRAG